MIQLSPDQAAELFRDMENGTANKVTSASFTDGSEDGYHVDFWQIERRVVRCEYSSEDSSARLDEVTGEDLDLFRTIHHL